jgi:broad specificity phosphatase PhoE
MTDAGRAQLQERARRWQAQGIKFDAVIASAFVRAKERATIIAASLGMVVELDAGYAEISYLTGQAIWRLIELAGL